MNVGRFEFDKMNTVKPLYKAHMNKGYLPKDNTVCSLNCIELCTNLPLN